MSADPVQIEPATLYSTGKEIKSVSRFLWLDLVFVDTSGRPMFLI